jgi:hypothetical protein
MPRVLLLSLEYLILMIELYRVGDGILVHKDRRSYKVLTTRLTGLLPI